MESGRGGIPGLFTPGPGRSGRSCRFEENSKLLWGTGASGFQELANVFLEKHKDSFAYFVVPYLHVGSLNPLAPEFVVVWLYYYLLVSAANLSVFNAPAQQLC